MNTDKLPSPMNALPPISTTAPDESQVWDHLIPLGEFPGQAKKPGGEKMRVVQVATAENVARMAEDLNARAADANWPGILLDLEHYSETESGSTEAAAWYREFEARPDGLYGKAERTDLGRAKISGKNYRRLSPVTELTATNEEDRFLITGLRSVALTNKPNMRALKILSANREPAPLSIEPEPMRKNPMNENTLTLLGLNKDADAEAIESAVTALNKRATESEAKLNAIEADTFAAENADRFEGGAEEAKTLFVENREAAEAVVKYSKKAVAAPAPEKPEGETPKVLNRQDTQTPDTSKITGTGEDDGVAESRRAVCVHNRALEIQREEGLTYTTAWKRAEAEIETPEKN